MQPFAMSDDKVDTLSLSSDSWSVRTRISVGHDVFTEESLERMRQNRTPEVAEKPGVNPRYADQTHASRSRSAVTCRYRLFELDDLKMKNCEGCRKLAYELENASPAKNDSTSLTSPRSERSTSTRQRKHSQHLSFSSSGCSRKFPSHPTGSVGKTTPKRRTSTSSGLLNPSKEYLEKQRIVKQTIEYLGRTKLLSKDLILSFTSGCHDELQYFVYFWTDSVTHQYAETVLRALLKAADLPFQPSQSYETEFQRTTEVEHRVNRFLGDYLGPLLDTFRNKKSQLNEYIKNNQDQYFEAHAEERKEVQKRKQKGAIRRLKRVYTQITWQTLYNHYVCKRQRRKVATRTIQTWLVKRIHDNSQRKRRSQLHSALVHSFDCIHRAQIYGFLLRILLERRQKARVVRFLEWCVYSRRLRRRIHRRILLRSFRCIHRAQVYGFLRKAALAQRERRRVIRQRLLQASQCVHRAQVFGFLSRIVHLRRNKPKILPMQTRHTSSVRFQYFRNLLFVLIWAILIIGPLSIWNSGSIDKSLYKNETGTPDLGHMISRTKYKSGAKEFKVRQALAIAKRPTSGGQPFKNETISSKNASIFASLGKQPPETTGHHLRIMNISQQAPKDNSYKKLMSVPVRRVAATQSKKVGNVYNFSAAPETREADLLKTVKNIDSLEQAHKNVSKLPIECNSNFASRRNVISWERKKTSTNSTAILTTRDQRPILKQSFPKLLHAVDYVSTTLKAFIALCISCVLSSVTYFLWSKYKDKTGRVLYSRQKVQENEFSASPVNMRIEVSERRCFYDNEAVMVRQKSNDHDPASPKQISIDKACRSSRRNSRARSSNRSVTRRSRAKSVNKAVRNPLPP